MFPRATSSPRATLPGAAFDTPPPVFPSSIRCRASAKIPATSTSNLTIRSPLLTLLSIVRRSAKVMETYRHNAGISRQHLGISAKDSDMGFASSFSSRMGGIFAHVAPNCTLRQAFPKAAKFLGMGERRVRAIWAQEAREIRLAEEKAIFMAEASIAEDFLEKKVAQYADTLEYAALRLAAECPDTHQDCITRYRGLARRVRRLFDREDA